MNEAMAVQPSAAKVKAAASVKIAALVKPAQQPEAAVKPAEAKPAPAAEKPAESASPEDAMKAAMATGEKVYASTCAVCHQPAGTGLPPTFPALKGGKITTGPVKAHIHQVLFGKQGTAMQAFMNQLTDQEIADVVTYERNAWGNNMGDLVTAADVKAVRQQGQNNKQEGA